MVTGIFDTVCDGQISTGTDDAPQPSQRSENLRFFQTLGTKEKVSALLVRAQQAATEILQPYHEIETEVSDDSSSANLQLPASPDANFRTLKAAVQVRAEQSTENPPSPLTPTLHGGLIDDKVVDPRIAYRSTRYSLG
jgi:hypothetical protein